MQLARLKSALVFWTISALSRHKRTRTLLDSSICKSCYSTSKDRVFDRYFFKASAVVRQNRIVWKSFALFWRMSIYNLNLWRKERPHWGPQTGLEAILIVVDCKFFEIADLIVNWGGNCNCNCINDYCLKIGLRIPTSPLRHQPRSIPSLRKTYNLYETCSRADSLQSLSRPRGYYVKV